MQVMPASALASITPPFLISDKRCVQCDNAYRHPGSRQEGRRRNNYSQHCEQRLCVAFSRSKERSLAERLSCIECARVV